MNGRIRRSVVDSNGPVTRRGYRANKRLPEAHNESESEFVVRWRASEE